MKRYVNSTGVVAILAISVVLFSSSAWADTLTSYATKDLKVGQGRDASGTISAVALDSTGNLGVVNNSGAKLYSFIGGFDVSQFTAVTSATLNFYLVTTGDGGATQTIKANALTIDWSEATVLNDLSAYRTTTPSWSLIAPPSTSSCYSTVGTASSATQHFANATWVSMDVTTIVTNWVNGSVGSADKGFELYQGYWAVTDVIASRETSGGTYKPYLVVTGTVPEPATMSLLVLGGLGGLLRRRK